MDRKSLV